MLSYGFSMRLPRFTLVLTWSTVMLALVMASSSLQAQTPESKSSQKLTEKDREFVIKRLKASRERFVTAVAGLSEAQWKFEWAPGSSIYSAAEHITLSEEYIFNFIINELLKTPATPEKQRKTADEKVFWDSEEGVDDPGAGLGDVDLTWNSIDEMMKEFESRRSGAIEFVKTTKDDLRAHFAPLGNRGEIDALQWLLVLSGHCEFHVAMINGIKAEANFPKR
jgi:hypothetical protein